MPTRLLATKLHVPVPRSQLVSRPRLLDRLDPLRALTLVSAPAGFGKTTLLAEWIAHDRQSECGMRVAWLSMDDGDNDPSRFVTYVVSALQTLDVGIGSEALSLLADAPGLPVDIALTALINDAATAHGPIVLVLDDFHVIDARPVHQAVGFLLDHLPSQLRLAIASRTDPPLPLARLRSRGELTELRAADLRFTRDEAHHPQLALRFADGRLAGARAVARNCNPRPRVRRHGRRRHAGARPLLRTDDAG